MYDIVTSPFFFSNHSRCPYYGCYWTYNTDTSWFSKLFKVLVRVSIWHTHIMISFLKLLKETMSLIRPMKFVTGALTFVTCPPAGDAARQRKPTHPSYYAAHANRIRESLFEWLSVGKRIDGVNIRFKIISDRSGGPSDCQPFCHSHSLPSTALSYWGTQKLGWEKTRRWSLSQWQTQWNLGLWGIQSPNRTHPKSNLSPISLFHEGSSASAWASNLKDICAPFGQIFERIELNWYL